MSLTVTQLIHGKNRNLKGGAMEEFINNLAYEIFSVLVVVFFVLVLYLVIKLKHNRDESDHL